MFCADVHWRVSLRDQSNTGKGAVPRERGPRNQLIGEKEPGLTNRKEPRFGHWTPHLDSSDWCTAVPPHESPLGTGGAWYGTIGGFVFPVPRPREVGVKSGPTCLGVVGGSQGLRCEDRSLAW